MHWFEDDESVLGAPFFVMGKVEGNVPADNPPYTQTGWILDEATPAVRARVVESGLDALVADPPDGLAQARLRLPRQAAVRRARHRAADRVLRAVVRVGGARPAAADRGGRARLGAGQQADRRAEHLALAWGDARINNQMFDDAGNVVAVFDWEMVTLADPMMDLGVVAVPRPPLPRGHAGARALEGFPTREEMVARYEELTGWTPHDLEFYEVFAGLRFAVVMMRIAALLVEFELMPSDTDMDRNNIVTRLLAAKLGLPAPGPEPLPEARLASRRACPSTSGRGVRARRGRLRGRRACPSRWRWYSVSRRPISSRSSAGLAHSNRLLSATDSGAVCTAMSRAMSSAAGSTSSGGQGAAREAELAPPHDR